VRCILFGVAVLAAAPAAAQTTTCLRNYDQIICSDGRMGLETPDGTLWSDGRHVYRNGDQIFISPPSDPDDRRGPPPLIRR
jgi:hypothetical protein